MILKGEGRSPEKRPLDFDEELRADLKENSDRRAGMVRWGRLIQESNGQDSVRKQACTTEVDGLMWVPRGRSPWRRVGHSRAERQKVLARASGPQGWGPKLKKRRGP